MSPTPLALRCTASTDTPLKVCDLAIGHAPLADLSYGLLCRLRADERVLGLDLLVEPADARFGIAGVTEEGLRRGGNGCADGRGPTTDR